MPRLRLIALTLIRVVLNTAHRMIYSFLPVFACGLGVDSTTISALVANRALFGAATPFLFPFIETRGRRVGVVLGLGLFVAGTVSVTVHPSLASLGIALVLAPWLYALGFSTVAGAAIVINLFGLAAVWYMRKAPR